MIKHEIRVDFPNSASLESIIKKAYFDEGDNGKILGNNNYIVVDESNDSICYSIFKGLNNATVKIVNEDVIDGTMRFLIDETKGEIRLYPISIYCIKDLNRWIFY